MTSEPVQKPESQEVNAATEAAGEKPREPTIIFLFDMKNWSETITSLSKLDLFDIAPKVSTQFYMDFGINAYVLILTKTKWDGVQEDIKRKFMIISRRIKEEMEGPMQTQVRERYEQSDIFKLLMGDLQSVETSTELQQPEFQQPEQVTKAESIKNSEDLDSLLIDINSIED
jgi:predicted patatin/cPLA2 family phospholipase